MKNYFDICIKYMKGGKNKNLLLLSKFRTQPTLEPELFSLLFLFEPTRALKMTPMTMIRSI